MPSGTIIRPSQKVRIPACLPNWFPVSYAITAEGNLARICAQVDVRRRWRDHYTRMSRGEPTDATIFPPGTQARADLFDGTALLEGPTFVLETVFPKFDRRLDGRWIVTDSRCPVGELNARIINVDGTVARRICVGDGVLSLQYDQLGCIWVGYFDEGIFGGYGWGDRGMPAPIGAPGVNRFDEFGHVLPTYRVADLPGPDISDCYAMNVTPNGVWLCPYVDFPILRIGYDGTIKLWQNKDIFGASAIAVDADYVVLVGGYQDNKNRGALLRLGQDRATLESEFRLEIEGTALDQMAFVTARNDTIHFVGDDAWYRVDVATIVREFR